MSTKILCGCAIGLLLFGSPIYAQYEGGQIRTDPTHVPTPAAPEGTSPTAGEHAPYALSNYITYANPDCCGPIGGDGPIREELYGRTGPTMPVEGKLLGHILETGWEVAAGGRSLFYNPSMTAAWALDISVSNSHFQGQHSDIKLPLDVLVPNQFGTPTLVHIDATLRNLNLTYASVWGGKEWYGSIPANHCTMTWRAGLDIGGALGSGRAEFEEIRHRASVVTFAGAAVHTDLEMPCGCCTYLCGFRTEWNYNWVNMLQSNNGQFETVNFLFTAGVRF
jgi:hypothetical protein